ncbi:hypothetical protein ILUMI_22066 [Ignelater luminosus]|uniref:28S ribosomal protein S27, mitochondrial n=1 Tax=Ignelater luminosus TaxID=2038154 RepID=A0A8K0G389_IGNLU|nr:hypothetical protein ILUMI_22066 [Ignelater luminosus]
MFKLLNTVIVSACKSKGIPQKLSQLIQSRTFLSQAYYCNEVWEQRFQDPLLQKVNLDELYNELDQKYQKSRNISAVDVDIFVNAVKEETYDDEMLDLVHKLRMSADSYNSLSSTSHGIIRNLSNFGKTEQLLSVLDDRLNYGIFLDDYTANLLLDTFWKKKDYLSGARTASQLMLQEEFEHPLCTSLSLLHCYNYLLNPTEWPQPPKPDEPEEEVKIRVNYLRNPYDDNHFDLRDPIKIVGKTLLMATKQLRNTLDKSLHLLGLALFEANEEANQLIEKLSKNNDKIYEDILKLIPEENSIKLQMKKLQTESADIQQLLQENVKLAEQKVAEKDVALQCETYAKWEQERKQALERQHERLLTAKRLANIEETQKQLKEKEELLWYFENEEKIELQIEEKKALLEEHAKKHQTKPKIKTDDTYLPPEIVKKYVQ